MKLKIAIGSRTQTVELPDRNVRRVLEPNSVQHRLTGSTEVIRAMQFPIGAPMLHELVHAGEKIAIVTSDITRPMPTYKVMPALLDELYAAGIRPEDVRLIFALGIHRPHTEAEKKKLAGERAYAEIACLDSDPLDCVHMGRTRAGTPVDITRAVAEADRRICLGNIEYHYFAGYSGGAKAIMPGVSTREAIQSNHTMMVRKEACAGRIDGNPVRRDIEEAGAICGIDYIVNVVLDAQKEIIHAVAGDVTLAHREGCRFLDTLYRKTIDRRADIVIVSQGGAPKDINLYQTQKALDNAKHAVKKGGVIILVGSCKEGFGENVFEQWLLGAEKPGDLTDRIRKEFQLGGHKAAAIAMVLEDAEIYLVSDLKPELVRRIFMTPFSTVQEAVNAAFAKQGGGAEVLVMPYGGSTLPMLQNPGVVGAKT